MSATAWAWLVLLFPLLGSIAIALGFKALPAQRRRGRSAPPRSASPSSAAIARPDQPARRRPRGAPPRLLALGLRQRRRARHQARHLRRPALGLHGPVVTGVSTLIHLYSFGYMQSDEGYHRFFSYLNFFVFSMLLLVLAGNFVLLIVGWAFVGFASYALISFWYRRDDRDPGRDEGLRDQRRRRHRPRPRRLPDLPRTRDLRIQRGLRQGAAGLPAPTSGRSPRSACCSWSAPSPSRRSCRFHTWLPDAMEGPTPVSSLIHAATMVTAGVYLIARTHVLFVLAPTAADIAAFVGLATLLVAGTIALVMTDLKRAIAYSTMSQIGYMIMGVSIGAYSAGHVPPDDPRLLQGAALHGGRLDHRRDGQRAEHRQDERLRQGDALHLDHDALRRPRPRRLPRHLGLLLQGRDPRLRRPRAAGCT